LDKSGRYKLFPDDLTIDHTGLSHRLSGGIRFASFTRDANTFLAAFVVFAKFSSRKFTKMKIQMKFFAFALAALVSLFLTTAALAQTSTTGTVEGTITDPNGAVVPNVTVTLTGPNLIRAQTATTDENGVYHFPQVPPGRYSVETAAAAGFVAKKTDNVDVNLGRSTTVNIALTAGGVGASVDVVATPEVDQTNNTTGTNVSSEQFSNFPTQRTVQGLYTIAPTVTRSGLRDASGRDRDPSVAGSSGPENSYILDGVNTTDPAFGGAGANLPFEFVQEVEVKTGAYGAEYGHATGGIFNVITKSGGNEFHGDVFGYFTPKSFVLDVKSSAIPQTGAASSKFSDVDAGFDVGGPIIKNKLWFFGAFNPQIRKNEFLTQTFHVPVENKITTPFYAGKLTWGINNNNIFTFSTFGDFGKQTGFLFGLNSRAPNSGFGANLDSFRGTIKTGGQNYTARLNSTLRQNWIGEFMFGIHNQKADTLPLASEANNSLIVDNFAALVGNTIAPVVNTTNVQGGLTSAFVDGRGGTLQRNYTRDGFGLVSNQTRERWEWSAKFQNIFSNHTLKYGFEFNQNRYKIHTFSSGPARTFADPNGEEAGAAFPATSMPGGIRITNRYGICTVPAGSTVAQCPISSTTTRLANMITAGAGPTGLTGAVLNSSLTPAQLALNPILVLQSVRVRDFLLNTGSGSTSTDVEGFYVQDDWKLSPTFQLNLGVRWDYQQAYGTSATYIKLNNWFNNLQPRIGFIWDFTGKGKGKIFANYARFLETPIPLDINVRAGGDDIQLDRNANVSRLNAGPGSVILAGTASGLGCLGCEATPVDQGLKPQTVNEWTAGLEYELYRNFAIGIRGIYRAQGSVIEDGSFDDGEHYFLFNPGEIYGPGTAGGPTGNTEFKACSDPTIGCFGRARRYYRALEFTATKRFANRYQFIASYVYSSLIGNYEGLYRNDNGQTDPNITSLFDLPSLLANTYGRLPNDRPHQFKFNGSYQTPFKLVVSGNFYAQSGIPFNALIPHPVYGDNEGFSVPRGTAVNPVTGSTRTPFTYQLDFGAYYPIPLGEKRELRFMFDWFNVTNVQRAVRQDETFKINSGLPGAPNPALQFANPSFGTGTIFQFPSTFRLGAKFSF
jgi:outer membrane receptor protein involved in Fe transport